MRISPGSRTTTALLGFAVSVVVSLALALYFDTLFVFLFLPFVPFFLGGEEEEPPVKECPECGFTTRHEGYDHCPRDGSELDTRSL
ncbi:MAG: hypothetical protein SV760_03680 [Halobacteria archaeon]|nr:hypothetical protein [Halobacteria archaeon]